MSSKDNLKVVDVINSLTKEDFESVSKYADDVITFFSELDTKHRGLVRASKIAEIDELSNSELELFSAIVFKLLQQEK